MARRGLLLVLSAYVLLVYIIPSGGLIGNRTRNI